MRVSVWPGLLGQSIIGGSTHMHIKTHPKAQHFYPRMKNPTNIRFNNEEMQMLKYGLNYCIERPVTSYITNLLAETERAIKLLDGKVQNTYRFLATNKLKQIISSTNQQNATQKRQLHVIKKT